MTFINYVNIYLLYFIFFFNSAKVAVSLHPPPANKEPGPCVSSPYGCVKFSFKQGGHSEVEYSRW